MYNLIRRISTSVIPRPDRPWEEDATSNAPSRKRRLSMNRDEETANIKKAKAEQPKTPVDTPSVLSEPASEAQTEPLDDLGESEATVDTKNSEPGVKEVTQGVKDLEVNQADTEVAPENVPLPPEAGDSPSPSSSIASTPSPETPDKSPDTTIRQESEHDDSGQLVENLVESSDANEGEESGTSTGAETSS